MINLIKRDFKLYFMSKGNLLTFISLYPVAFLLLHDRADITTYPIVGIILIFTMTYLSLNYDWRYSTHILYKSLPISNMEFVLSKYILMFINYIVVVFYMLIVKFIMKSIGLADYQPEHINIDIFIYLLNIIIISLSITMPIVFYFQPRIGDIIGRVAMFTTVNRVIYSLVEYGGVNTQLIKTYTSTKITIISIVSMLISIILSIYVFSKKEFRG